VLIALRHRYQIMSMGTFEMADHYPEKVSMMCRDECNAIVNYLAFDTCGLAAETIVTFSETLG